MRLSSDRVRLQRPGSYISSRGLEAAAPLSGMPGSERRWPWRLVLALAGLLAILAIVLLLAPDPDSPAVPNISAPSGPHLAGPSAPDLAAPSGPDISLGTPSVDAPDLPDVSVGTPNVAVPDPPSADFDLSWLWGIFSFAWHVLVFLVLIPWWVVLALFLIARWLLILWRRRRERQEEERRAQNEREGQQAQPATADQTGSA